MIWSRHFELKRMSSKSQTNETSTIYFCSVMQTWHVVNFLKLTLPTVASLMNWESLLVSLCWWLNASHPKWGCTMCKQTTMFCSCLACFACWLAGILYNYTPPNNAVFSNQLLQIYFGGSMVKWSEHWTCNSEAPSSSPALTISWICSRHGSSEFKSSATLVK